MRKLVFGLAFMLIGTFAFANNSVEHTKPIINKTEKSVEHVSVYKIKKIDEDGTCKIYHWVYRNGRYIGGFVIVAPDTHEDCGGSVFHMN